MKRVASVIGLPPENREEYERYHAAVWPGVLAAIEAAGIRNYSIFRHGDLLFSYFEYVGDDYEGDMARMAEDPTTREWWAVQEPLQRQLPGTPDGEWWMPIDEVFHHDGGSADPAGRP
ncbi:L-rhamnose mutarotase [Microbacterium halophytorum]|uniref:L-rhamnose mutarotase n=1 Tax=Microbacterium halophytorum TaxID=2067568 RepID=UPI000CFAA1D8|nr:L-rhamnose mutarotase [Microbacterium halophytorum]